MDAEKKKKVQKTNQDALIYRTHFKEKEQIEVAMNEGGAFFEDMSRKAGATDYATESDKKKSLTNHYDAIAGDNGKIQSIMFSYYDDVAKATLDNDTAKMVETAEQLYTFHKCIAQQEVLNGRVLSRVSKCYLKDGKLYEKQIEQKMDGATVVIGETIEKEVLVFDDSLTLARHSMTNEQKELFLKNKFYDRLFREHQKEVMAMDFDDEGRFVKKNGNRVFNNDELAKVDKIMVERDKMYEKEYIKKQNEKEQQRKLEEAENLKLQQKQENYERIRSTMRMSRGLPDENYIRRALLGEVMSVEDYLRPFKHDYSATMGKLTGKYSTFDLVANTISMISAQLRSM